MIAIEFEINHTIALKITKTIFVIIQTMLTLIICFSLFMDFGMVLNFIFELNISESKFYARGDEIFQKDQFFSKKSETVGIATIKKCRKNWQVFFCI